jgi:RNA polymerase sigma-70 factor (ECF subfamily)
MFIGRYIHDYDVAKEMAQDCLISLYQTDITNRAEAELKGYLFSAAKRKSINYSHYITNKKRNVNENAMRIVDEEWEALPSEEIESHIIRTNVVSVLLKIAQGLPVKCRRVFELIYIDGLTYEEIEKLDGTNISTCRNHHNRAIGIIKKVVNGQYKSTKRTIMNKDSKGYQNYYYEKTVLKKVK